MSSNSFRLADDTSLSIGGRLVVVVVNEETEERSAFYHSSGTHGGADSGQWCPFHGLSLYAGQLWFVKAGVDRKLALDDTWEAEAAQWLAAQEIPEPTITTTGKFHKKGMTTAERLAILDDLEAAQKWLDFAGCQPRQDMYPFSTYLPHLREMAKDGLSYN